MWGVWWGPPAGRYIIEVDVLLSNLYYTWGDATLNQSLMDLQNILTHELGHGAGMDDVYKPPALQETTFGYSTEGETTKRDLYIGDKLGIAKLYSE